MAAKRGNPDYSQMLIYVPKQIAVKFKTLCTANQVEQSEVMTNLMVKWIEEQEQNK